VTARLFPARPLVALWLSPTGIVACIVLADQATVAALAAENAKLAAQVPGLQTAMKTLPPPLPLPISPCLDPLPPPKLSPLDFPPTSATIMPENVITPV